MARLKCPRCAHLFSPPAGGAVACPSCGYAQAAAPTAPSYAPAAPAPAFGAPTVAPPGSPTAASGGFQPAPPAVAPKKTNGLAVASMVLGILSLCTFFIGGPLLGVGALVVGILSRQQIGKDPASGGDGMAVAGIVLGSIAIGLWLLFALFAFVFTEEVHFPWPRRPRLFP